MNLDLGDTRLIIAECVKQGLLRNQCAYVLATSYWESARTMRPVREYGGEKYLRGKKYYPYVGMGYVQLTWLANYKKASAKLGVDFVANPKLLLEPNHAVKVLVTGMREGWFTGKKLADYVTLSKSDYVGARRIVNGTDKAAQIAKIAIQYEAALNVIGYGSDVPSAAVYEVLAMGTNDFGKPEVARTSLTAAIANAKARGRKPVVVVPNKGNPRISAVADVVRSVAAEAGVDVYEPAKWAGDKVHPAQSEYTKLGALYDGQIIRGDSFGVGIAGAQKTRNPLSWTLQGVSSARVLKEIERKDGGSLSAPVPAPTKTVAVEKTHWLTALIEALLALFGKRA